jgi:hypothetical protein
MLTLNKQNESQESRQSQEESRLTKVLAKDSACIRRFKWRVKRLIFREDALPAYRERRLLIFIAGSHEQAKMEPGYSSK